MRLTVADAMAELGRIGGKARARKLTARRKSEIARMGAQARWAKWRAMKQAEAVTNAEILNATADAVQKSARPEQVADDAAST